MASLYSRAMPATHTAITLCNLSTKALVAVTLSLCTAFSAQAQARFHFVALGDMPYGPAAQSYPPYRQLIGEINRVAPAFSVHVGDFKSGSMPCTDELFAQQQAHFQRFEGALVYTPGDNDWTDCHRGNNGGFDPLERLAALRRTFFRPGQSLGQLPMPVENQSSAMPAHAKFIENQRWHVQGVTFATLHMVGSNNNLEARDLASAAEFFERDAANVAWLEAAFQAARERESRAIVIAFQADVFETRSAFEAFPGWSGFKRAVEDTLLPLASQWGKPVLVIHGDSHQFRIDQPFAIKNRVLKNVTRLIVPGAADVRAVRIDVQPSGAFAFELIQAP